MGTLHIQGGVSIFQKCPNLNYFAIILQYYLYKKCRKIKNFWIWSEGGGQQFSKMSEIQKSLKFPMGGGGQAYLGIFPKFFRFFLWWLPLHEWTTCIFPMECYSASTLISRPKIVKSWLREGFKKKIVESSTKGDFPLRKKIDNMGLKHWIFPKNHFKTHLFFSSFGWGGPFSAQILVRRPAQT